MLAFKFGKFDEKTEGYDEALLKINDGKIQEQEIVENYVLTLIESLNNIIIIK